MGEGTVQFRRKKAFATLYREVAQDGRLSLESRGLLVLMASLPENWEYSVAGLAKKAGCGKDKLRRILGELEKVGYLAREQSHDRGGKFGGNIYIIQDDAPPLSGKPDNGQTRQRETPSPAFPTQKKNIGKVEDKKKPPKAPQGGKRPSKYDLAEDAKPVLQAYVGEDGELHRALADLIEIRVAKKAIIYDNYTQLFYLSIYFLTTYVLCVRFFLLCLYNKNNMSIGNRNNQYCRNNKEE